MNKDLEADEIKERKGLIKEIYQSHGESTRTIIFIARLLELPLVDVADAWKMAGIEFQDALYSTGKFYG